MSFRAIFDRLARIARSELSFPNRDFDAELRRAQELIEESRQREERRKKGEGGGEKGKGREAKEEGRRDAGASAGKQESSNAGSGGMSYELACRTLRVASGSTFEQVAAAYRLRIREIHPDRHGRLSAAEQERTMRATQELNLAYEFLERHFGR
jgi:site-specific DNA-cytosine methylase